MNVSTVLVAGIKGHVVCIRKADGVELWRTRLRGSGVTCVCVEDTSVFAATKGHLYSLNLANGAILWVNGLPKLGYGMCVMATPNQSAVAVLNLIAQQQAIAIAAVAASSGAVAAAAGS